MILEEEAESRVVGPFSHISTRKGDELLKSALGIPDSSEEHLLPSVIKAAGPSKAVGSIS